MEVVKIMMVADAKITHFFDQVVPLQMENTFKCLVDELFERKSCYLFGAAQMGRKFIDILGEKEIEVSGIADNNASLWGSFIDGVQVVNPKSIPQDAIVVLTSKYVKDLYKQMKEGLYNKLLPHYALTVYLPDLFPNMAHEYCRDIFLDEKESIQKAYNLLCDESSKELFMSLLSFRISLDPEQLPMATNDEYNPAFVWSFSENESYVDVGAYDGDTLRFFLRTVLNFSNYYAFEPDPALYLKLQKTADEYSDARISIYSFGVGAETKDVFFSAGGGLDSHITDNGTEKITIVPLDTFLDGKKITSIKMDVEGYEAEVIKGAHNIIVHQRPKLAICVYHRPTDLWRLLLQVYAANPNYRFYLRHHEPEIFGSVLYCV